MAGAGSRAVSESLCGAVLRHVSQEWSLLMNDDPVWRDLIKEDFPDSIPRRVVGQALDLADTAEFTPHAHRKSQLLYVVSGVITVRVASGLWTVPPSCAIWIPGGCIHSASITGQVSLGCLYVEPDASSALRPECGIIFVQPLLRELMFRFIAAPRLYETGNSRESRLADVLIDELNAAPEEPLHLPMPRDRRLVRVVDMFLEDPARRMTIDEWGARVGASNRTLSRLFREETGLTFAKWRQRLHIGLALQRLASGQGVTTIALDLGYESLSAFIAMFKRTLGTTPSRYFSDHPSALPEADGSKRAKTISSGNVITLPAPLGRSRSAP